MEFFQKTGKKALGSRLRRLSEMITDDSAKVYRLYDIDFQPRWFPVFYILSQEGDKNITEIAREIGHSHVSVIQIVKEMMKKGFVMKKKDKKDGRQTIIALSKSGMQIAEKIKPQYTDVNNAIEKTLSEADNDLWKAIEEWEHLLAKRSLFERVRDQRKEREMGDVAIVDYTPKYKKAFRGLNEEWISTYFKMEEADFKVLNNPAKNILNKGGHIFVALYKGEPAGVCALIRMDKQTYELAKMAVSPTAQGKGIGVLLGEAIIKKAKKLGASTLYLESNTILESAINLYYKLGFKKVTGHPTPYQRCNIQMELSLK